MLDNNACCRSLFKAATLAFLVALIPQHALGQAPAKKTPAASRGSVAAPRTGKQMIHPSYNYILDVDPNPYAYTVRVNGWTLSSSPGDANTHFSSTRLGLYLVEGQNSVSIHIGPPPKGVPLGHKFGVNVRDTQGIVVAYHWDPAKPHAPIPVQAEVHFEVPHLPHGPWAWQSAPKITLDAPAKAAINAHIKRLYDALNNKNADEATALFAHGNRDVAVMDDDPAAKADAASHADWVQEFSDPHWRMDPIDYSTLRYTLEADGRAVQVQRANGDDVLQTSNVDKDGLLTTYDLHLSLIHGQWTRIR